jgi:hypothetical protein
MLNFVLINQADKEVLAATLCTLHTLTPPMPPTMSSSLTGLNTIKSTHLRSGFNFVYTVEVTLTPYLVYSVYLEQATLLLMHCRDKSYSVSHCVNAYPCMNCFALYLLYDKPTLLCMHCFRHYLFINYI